MERATEVVQEMQRFEIGKREHNESFSELMSHEPNLIYMHEVEEEKQVVLPIIRKIKDGMLILKDYTLDSGHLIGLAKALSTADIKCHSFMFNNCGIDD